MQFLEKNGPVILVIWLIFLTTAVTFKFVFWSSSDPAADTFSVEELMHGVHQNDSRLLEYIHMRQIYSPPQFQPIMPTIPEGPDSTDSLIKHQVTRDLIKVLKKKNNGFFMECRAYDGGDRFSKTLELEKRYNWSGILMEPDPYLFPELVAKKRNKAWLLNACLSPDPTAHNLEFLRKIHQKDVNDTGIVLQDGEPPKKPVYRDRKGNTWSKMRVPCFPLFSVVSAIGVKSIDFLILDTQGLELQILLNIPWDEMQIQVISANVQSIPEGPEGLVYFMNSKGFQLLSTNEYFYTFVNKELIPEN